MKRKLLSFAMGFVAVLMLVTTPVWMAGCGKKNDTPDNGGNPTPDATVMTLDEARTLAADVSSTITTLANGNVSPEPVGYSRVTAALPPDIWENLDHEVLVANMFSAVINENTDATYYMNSHEILPESEGDPTIDVKVYSYIGLGVDEVTFNYYVTGTNEDTSVTFASYNMQAVIKNNLANKAQKWEFDVFGYVDYNDGYISSQTPVFMSLVYNNDETYHLEYTTIQEETSQDADAPVYQAILVMNIDSSDNSYVINDQSDYNSSEAESLFIALKDEVIDGQNYIRFDTDGEYDSAVLPDNFLELI